jgi:hypothetical protein
VTYVPPPCPSAECAATGCDCMIEDLHSPDERMVGIEASALARLVWNVLATAQRQNLTMPPRLHGAVAEALGALDLDLDLTDYTALQELMRQ